MSKKKTKSGKSNKKIITLQERLDNAALSADIPIDVAKAIIVREHALNHMYKKNELSSMTVNLSGETYDMVTKISHNLKVSVSAILCVFLEEQLKKIPGVENENCNNI